MAIINNINFTYPILCSYNDDFNTDFKGGTIGDLRKTKGTSTVQVYTELNDYNLKNLIINKKAKIILKVYCPTTKYRTMIDLNLGLNEVTFKNRNINKKVFLQTLIVSAENIDNYYSENFNEDYKGKTFNIDKGSILAIGENEEVNIEKDIDELTSANSVVKINDSHKDDIPMYVEYDSDYIKIFLPSSAYKTYFSFSQFNCLPILNSMIIIPGIVDVLDKIAFDFDSELENKKWFRVLSKKISQATGNAFSIEYIKNHGSFEIVQKIFDCPVVDAMSLVDKYYNGGQKNEN